MDDVLRQVQGVLTAMQQRRWLGVAVAWAVALLGAAAVVVMRDRYEASARVFVDTQTVLKPLMTGLAFQPDIDQHVNMPAKTLSSPHATPGMSFSSAVSTGLWVCAEG